MNEVEYEHGEEMKARGVTAAANLKAILEDHDAQTIGQLARSAYKYTSCGVALGALLYQGEDLPGRWVFGSDLDDLQTGDAILALSVSSIVEGVEQATAMHVVDLFSEAFETPEQACSAYEAALNDVEIEAMDIWNATHGCEKCAEHFGFVNEDGLCEGNDGQTPVWSDCPVCKGAGVVI